MSKKLTAILGILAAPFLTLLYGHLLYNFGLSIGISDYGAMPGSIILTIASLIASFIFAVPFLEEAFEE